MKKIILLYSIILSIIPYNTSALPAKKSTQVLVKDCPNLACVRQNINLIDSKIIKLIGLRLTYVKRAGELKLGKQPIHNQAREDQILANVSQLAVANGFPSSIATEIYKTLLIQTNIYEKSTQREIIGRH